VTETSPRGVATPVAMELVIAAIAAPVVGVDVRKCGALVTVIKNVAVVSASFRRAGDDDVSPERNWWHGRLVIVTRRPRRHAATHYATPAGHHDLDD